MKTRYFILGLCLLLARGVHAQDEPKVLQTYDWNALAQRHELSGGEVVTMDSAPALKVQNKSIMPILKIPLFKILQPHISAMVYAVIGQVKYDHVNGMGYLEMWNYFPPLHPGMPEEQYFSRTLADSGEMAKITGSSEWRDFSLPFDRTGTTNPPSRLEINLCLPTEGTVYLRSVKLVEYGSDSPAADTAAAGWWPAAASPWIGGIGGPLVGCAGGLLGGLCRTGRARRLVLGTWMGFIIGGVISLGLAGVALFTGQPQYVWLPLLIFGVVPTTVMGVLWPQAKKSYDDFEIRRMASMDALKG